MGFALLNRSAGPGTPEHEPAPAPPGSRRAPVAGLAFAAYLAFALVVTWPWLTDPGDLLYGAIGADLTSNVAGFQQLADDLQPPFLPGRIADLNAPEGFPTDWPLHLAALGSSTTLWILSVAVGSVAAHGIVAIVGYALTALAMFLLVRRVTGHAGIAFVVGLAFGFWPYTYATGWTWPHYIHGWVFVVLVWRMLVVAEEPTLRNGVLAGGAALLAMTWIQYNLVLAGVAFATLAGVAVLRSLAAGRVRPQLRAQAVAAGMVVVVVGVLGVVATSGDFAGVPTRGTGDAVANSARPFMYLVPGPRHPLLGDATRPWLQEHTGGISYADVYLGIPLMLVGAFGLGWTLLRLRRGGWKAVRHGEVAVGLSGAALGAVGLAFSAPPKLSLLGAQVPMPYTVVNEITMVFRAAHRFAFVAMLGLCLLAAVTLARALQGRSARVQAIALVVLGVVFAVDLWAQPTRVTSRVEPPAIYALLARQPPGIVAEYPTTAPDITLNNASLYQDFHEHPLFAGFPSESPGWSRKVELQDLRATRTVPELAAYGVRYVVVHHPETGSNPTLPRAGRDLPGLRRLGGHAGADLYRVVARPATTSSYAVRGFHGPEGTPPGSVRWMAENGAQIELRADCRPCAGRLSFGSGTFARPRTLTITDDRGRTVLRRVIATPGERVTFSLRFTERTLLTFVTDPPPDQINAFVGGEDDRHFGVYVSQPVRFLRGAPASQARGGREPR
jgi:hypothetical protein